MKGFHTNHDFLWKTWTDGRLSAVAFFFILKRKQKVVESNDLTTFIFCQVLNLMTLKRWCCPKRSQVNVGATQNDLKQTLELPKIISSKPRCSIKWLQLTSYWAVSPAGWHHIGPPNPPVDIILGCQSCHLASYWAASPASWYHIGRLNPLVDIILGRRTRRLTLFWAATPVHRINCRPRQAPPAHRINRATPHPYKQKNTLAKLG